MIPKFMLSLLSAFSVFIVGISGWGLGTGRGSSTKHGEQLYNIWYLFSFTAYITFVVMTIDQIEEAFTKEGNPTGQLGKYIILSLESYVDIRTEISVFAGIALLVLLPPSMAYLLSGLYGFADWKIFFPKTLIFLVYSLLKALVCFSGIVIVILPWSYFHGWSKATFFEILCASFGSLLRRNVFYHSLPIPESTGVIVAFKR